MTRMLVVLAVVGSLLGPTVLAGESSVEAYNTACDHALQGRSTEALKWLRKAAALGFSEAAHMEKDPDLASLRTLPGYAQVAKEVAQNDAKRSAATNPALRDELLQMMQADQEARRALVKAGLGDKEAGARVAELDRKHTARMKEIVRAHGWPGRTLVSERGAFAAWILVQHADEDVAFQRECLPLMEAAVKTGEAAAKEWAYLVDRVLVAEGKPQRYGTQFWSPNGKMEPRPMEAPEQVDARRKSVGLGTMEEYRARMKRTYAR